MLIDLCVNFFLLTPDNLKHHVIPISFPSFGLTKILELYSSHDYHLCLPWALLPSQLTLVNCQCFLHLPCTFFIFQ